MGEEGIKYSGCDYLIFRTSWVYHPDYGNNFYRTMQRLAKYLKLRSNKTITTLVCML